MLDGRAECAPLLLGPREQRGREAPAEQAVLLHKQHDGRRRHKGEHGRGGRGRRGGGPDARHPRTGFRAKNRVVLP